MTWKMWEHNGWGNSLFFNDWKKRRIAGHLTPRPRVGEDVLVKMQSGKVAQFQIVAMDYMADPVDMFFGTVADRGYLE